MPHYSNSPARAVAITGVGAITPTGLTAHESFESSVLMGRSGIGEYSSDLSDIHAVGRIWDLPQEKADEDRWFLERTGVLVKRLNQIDRCTKLILSAGAEAMAEAGIVDSSSLALAPWVNRDRTGISIGTGAGGFQNFVGVDRKIEDTRRVKANNPDAELKIKPSEVLNVLGERVATVLSMESGAGGSVLAMLGACAAGNVAIAQAVKEIRSGDADIMLAGGGEAQINETAISMFNALGALDREPDYTRASRPFDETRGGFVMSEGAAVFVLESLEHALNRNADIKAVISGVGVSGDGDLRSNTLMNPEGPARAMRKALAQTAEWHQLYIKAHATATPEGDGKELEAVGKILNPEDIVGISSLKGHFGHTIGASGPIEVAIALYCMNNGIIPNTLKLIRPLVSEKIWPHVMGEPIRMGYDTALCSSFGFGGENATVILQKYNPAIHK